MFKSIVVFFYVCAVAIAINFDTFHKNLCVVSFVFLLFIAILTLLLMMNGTATIYIKLLNCIVWVVAFVVLVTFQDGDNFLMT